VTMDERELLARQFERHRAHLHRVAYRMLGSAAGADDAVQESWLRVSGAGADGVDNLRGWMTTIVGRVCLDMLRSPTARREESLDVAEPGPSALPFHEPSAEEDVEVADSVGLALLVVLETHFDALVAVLDPDVVVRADAQAVRMGGPAELHGATAVAEFFRGKAAAAVPGLIDGEVGVLVPAGARWLFALRLIFADGRIAGIHAVADAATLATLELEALGRSRTGPARPRDRVQRSARIAASIIT